MTSAPSVAFVGPVAREGQSAIGGYEAANRRTITLLSRAGVSVLEFPYHCRARPEMVEDAHLPDRVCANSCRKSSRGARRFNLCTSLRFAVNSSPRNWVLCHLAKLLHKKLLLDIRGGGLYQCI